jgi:hypothetical protein
MYRRELLILLALALLGAGLVATGTALFVRHLNTSVEAITGITIPDLVSTGQLIQQMTDNWTRVLLIQISASPEERSKLIHEIETHPTDPFLEDFRKTPTSPRQQVFFDRLIEERQQFMQLRLHYFEMARAGQVAQAASYLDLTLKPAFSQYHDQATQLFRVTADIGRERAKQVTAVSKQVIIVSAGLTVLMFFAGILLGFKTIFEGLAFANKIGKIIAPGK